MLIAPMTALPAAADQSQAAAAAAAQAEPAGITLVDSLTIPALTAEQNTVFGGLSGIDYRSGTGDYVAISDDRSENGQARFYNLQLPFDNSGFTVDGPTVSAVTSLKTPDGQPFGLKTVDPEAIRTAPAGDGIIWTSEGAASSGQPAFIRQAGNDGAYVREFLLPNAYQPILTNGVVTAGVRNNQALEGLTYSPNKNKLITITENALVQDGPAANQAHGSNSRLLELDATTGLPGAEYVYQVDSVPFAPTAPLPPPVNVLASDRGVSELLALSETDYLSVERSFASGVGFQIQIFRASTVGATNVSGVQQLSGSEVPMTKSLLFDLNASGVAVDNVEGITWGPDFADGSRSLILVADDNFGFNSSVTQFHLLKVPTALTDVPVQVLGINDFHGRIQAGGTQAGAAVLAGAVKQLRAANPHTVFAAAGDLIGASTFESFISKDKPTIDAMNAAGLEVSAVGNHEFDQGFTDLVDRVMTAYDPTTNPFGGALWQYLGANVRNRTDYTPALPETWMVTKGGINIGFVGVVTAHLDELVSPASISTLTVEDSVSAATRSAAELKDAGADLVILLAHDGASTTDLASATDPATSFGQIVTQAGDEIDAIFSGHTHLVYDHRVPVPGWAAQGRAVTDRPVVSSGQYGVNLNQLVFEVDSRNGEVIGLEQAVLPLAGNYPSDPETAAVVAAAVAASETLGAQPLGQLTAPFNRAKLAGGSTENRGGESVIGNQIAEIQRYVTSDPALGGAQIAFINPGGIRADLIGSPSPSYPADVTYKQAVQIQPFAGTLMNMTLTGADIRQILEQQWQPAGAARPFLKLGVSAGFTYTYDPTAAVGSRILTMLLNGQEIVATQTFSVTVNSFLAAGGDNFGAFTQGFNVRDTGQSDLAAVVAYLETNSPMAPDYTQRAVGTSFPAGASVKAGTNLTVQFSSLAFSTDADLKDSAITVSLNGASLGSFPVDNTVASVPTDEIGTSTVSVLIPVGTTPGAAQLAITGSDTGTSATVAFSVLPSDPVAETTNVTATVKTPVITYGSAARITVEVTGKTTPGGTVELRNGTQVVGTGTLTGGKVTITSTVGMAVGRATLTVVYLGDATHAASSASASVLVIKAGSQTTISPSRSTVPKGTAATVTVTVKATNVVATGKVNLYAGGRLLGTVTLINGTGQLTLSPSLKAKTYILLAVYGGDKNLWPSLGVATVTIR